MSKRAPRKGRTQQGSETRDDAPAGAGLYVYCVGRRAELGPLLDSGAPAAIESDARLELVEAGELAAVVSPVPLSDYGEAALEQRLSDPAWVAARVMRHELAVEHFAAAATVIPVRFASIYLSRESVERMLGEKDVKLRQTLQLLHGREEWGLNLYVDRKRLREAVADVSPRLREMREQADALSPGRAYMLRKKIDSLRDEEVAALRKQVRAEVARLGFEARGAGTASNPLRANEKTEQGEVVARFVFLLDRRRRKSLHSKAEKLAAEYAPLGFKMELVGPWPAYHFADFGGPAVEPEEASGHDLASSE